MSLYTAAAALLLLCSCFVGSQSLALANSYKHHQGQSGVACYGFCSVASSVLDCTKVSHPDTASGASKAVAGYFGIYSGRELHISLRNRNVVSSFSVASLYGPESLRQVDKECWLGDHVTVQLDSCCDYRLLPGSLDTFGSLKHLTLQMRFTHDRIPAGVFTAKLVCLQNLQIESNVVSEIEPRAFKELQHLIGLHISNLNVSHLTSTILQGLPNLRYLELPGNSLVSLDAASFAASSLLLEFIDLSTNSEPGLETVASDTFCGLPKLELLKYSGSLNLSCSNFQSPSIQLTLITGLERSDIRCVEGPMNHTDCKSEGLSPDSSTLPNTAMVCGDTGSTTEKQDATASSLTTVKSTTKPATKPTSIASGKHVPTNTVVKTTVVSSAAATTSSAPMPPIKPSRVSNPTPALTSAVFTTMPPVSMTGRPDQDALSAGAPVTVTAVVATIAVVLLAASVAIFIGVAWRRRRKFGPASRSLSLMPLVEDENGDL